VIFYTETDIQAVSIHHEQNSQEIKMQRQHKQTEQTKDVFNSILNKITDNPHDTSAVYLVVTIKIFTVA